MVIVHTATALDEMHHAWGWRPGQQPEETEPADDGRLLAHDADLKIGGVAPRNRMWRATCLAIAVTLHLVPALALIGPAPDGVGSGGIQLEAIGVEMVDTSVLESRRESAEASAAAAAQAMASTAGTAGTASETSASAAAATEQVKTEQPKQDSKEPDSTEIAAADQALTVPQASWAVDALRAPPRVDTERKPEAKSDPSPNASESPSGGAESAARTSVPSVATPAAAAAMPGEINRFVAGVRSSLARHKPRSKGGRTGTVMVMFSIVEDGSLDFVKVERSSGNTVLDQAAVDAVRKAAPFNRPPAGMVASARTFMVPYRFE